MAITTNDTAASDGFPGPPSYTQAEACSVLRLCIVNNPASSTSSSGRVITANPISSSGIFNNLAGTRSYYPRYKGKLAFVISCQRGALSSPATNRGSSNKLEIIHAPVSKDVGRFTLSHPNTNLDPSVFLLDAKCARVRTPGLNALLERFPPLKVEFLVHEGGDRAGIGDEDRDGAGGAPELRPFSWRAVLPQTQEGSMPHRSSSTRNGADGNIKSKGPQSIDLVLLNEEFKECAYFTNQLKPAHEEGSNVWGTIEIQQRINDDVFVDQVVLSLLALIHGYIDKAANGGRWSDVAVGMLSGSIMCQVM